MYFYYTLKVYVELEAIGAASAESRVRRILAVSHINCSLLKWHSTIFSTCQNLEIENISIKLRWLIIVVLYNI